MKKAVFRRQPQWNFPLLGDVPVSLNPKERGADKELARAVALEVITEHGVDCALVDPLRIAESLGIVVQASDKNDDASFPERALPGQRPGGHGPQ